MVRIFKDRITLLEEVLQKRAVCAEVGVCQGNFAQQIWNRSEPSVLHLIDIWAGINVVGIAGIRDEVAQERLLAVSQMFLGPIKLGQIFLHQGQSPAVLSAFRQEYFDWVYVDGDHSYEGVLADLSAIHNADIMKRGGLIAGHDYGLPEDLPNIKHPFVDIARAVDDFCLRYEWELMCRTQCGPKEGEDPDGSNAPSFVLARKGSVWLKDEYCT